MRPVAILRFTPTEGPGHFAEWLDARGIPRRVIAIDEGEPVPGTTDAFSGMALMGGPMSANDALPWIPPVLALLRSAVAADVPVIGHCLGGQLLAKALGAEVTRTPQPEIGWSEVTTTSAPEARRWFGRESFTTFQWHYEVFSLPPGALRVLTNVVNGEQAYALGKHIGLQSHLEMTRAMVETWCRTGAAELPAQTSGAVQSRSDIVRDLDSRLRALVAVADGVYSHWAAGLLR